MWAVDLIAAAFRAERAALLKKIREPSEHSLTCEDTMTEDAPTAEPDIDNQIACIKREIAIRERVYPGWVKAGKMFPSRAEHEIAAMKAALHTLIAVKERGQ